jgi:hypothetical protein
VLKAAKDLLPEIALDMNGDQGDEDSALMEEN